jgi:dCTP diphosphatase
LTNRIEDLKREVKEFIRERDWEQFHSPKNLAIGLSVEASELLEMYTWLTDEQSENLPTQKLSMVKDEIGDILIYLVEFCSLMELDPVECAFQKLGKNSIKYPISKSKGNATKYTDF